MAEDRQIALAYLHQASALHESARTMDFMARAIQPTLNETQVEQRKAIILLAQKLIQSELEKIMDLMSGYWETYRKERINDAG